MGSLMLKAWRKSCRRPYQHFKAAKDQCDAFNGGEKPFCARLRGGRVGFWGLSSDFSQPRREIDSFTVSQELPSSAAPRRVYFTCARAGDMPAAVDARLLWGAGALMWSRLNSAPLWGLVFSAAAKRCNSSLVSPITRVLQTAHAYVWPWGWDVIAASNMKTSLAWFCHHITALHRAALGCTSWSDRDWLTKVSA